MAKPLAVALTMWVAAVSASPVAPQLYSAAGRAKVWIDAVQNHRPGELDDAVRAIAQWPQADLIEAAGAARSPFGRDYAAVNRLLTSAAERPGR